MPRKAVARALFWLLSCSFLTSQGAFGEEVRLRVLHTNDLQSRLLPFAPNADYTPEISDDSTLGGVARLATAIQTAREETASPVLTLDGGDIMMGTIFQVIAETHGTEIRLLQALGYDAAVLGNHEFDFRSDGLARIVEAAASYGPIPKLLLTNVEADPEDPRDDAFAALYDRGLVHRFTVLERGGLRIGLFGLMGHDAGRVASYAKPLTFTDRAETAREMVRFLREEEKVDLVIALSHGGVDLHSREEGEDPDLAAAVPGIDVIVGGHSHIPLPETVQVGKTTILQAGSEARWLGVLDLVIDSGEVRVEEYELRPVDDALPADPEIAAQVEEAVEVIDTEFLPRWKMRFHEEIFETHFDLFEVREEHTRSNIGALVADALLWSINRYQPTDVTLTTAGMIRDEIVQGKSGIQRTSDAFRVLPLGIGTVEPTPGYPLVRGYVTGAELKTVAEILVFGHRLRGNSFYPFFAGMRFHYNPLRPPLDRVFSVELGNEADGYREIDVSPHAEQLYSIGMNAYTMSFIGIVDSLSQGLLSVEPKHADGRPIASVREALVDADPELPGIQEVKNWTTLIDFTRSLPDLDGDGISEIPEKYRTARAEMIPVASLNPQTYFRNGTRILWGASLLFLTASLLIFYFIRRRLRRRQPESV